MTVLDDFAEHPRITRAVLFMLTPRGRVLFLRRRLGRRRRQRRRRRRRHRRRRR